jgi:hypothetical protein
MTWWPLTMKARSILTALILGLASRRRAGFWFSPRPHRCDRIKRSNLGPEPDIGEGMMNILSRIGCCLLLSMGIAAEAIANDRFIGRCYMEECSWNQVQHKRVLESDRRGALYEVAMLYGNSSHPNGLYPEEGKGETPRISWEKKADTTYVFCSRHLPAVMYKHNKAKTLDVRVFSFPEGVPGVDESSASIYKNICHPGSGGLSDEALVEKFKYKELEGEDKEKERDFDKPQEIFCDYALGGMMGRNGISLTGSDKRCDD